MLNLKLADQYKLSVFHLLCGLQPSDWPILWMWLLSTYLSRSVLTRSLIRSGSFRHGRVFGWTSSSTSSVASPKSDVVSTIKMNFSSVVRFIFCITWSPNKRLFLTTANIIFIISFDFGLVNCMSALPRVSWVPSQMHRVDEDGRICSLRTNFWIVFKISAPLSNWNRTLQLFTFFFYCCQCGLLAEQPWAKINLHLFHHYMVHFQSGWCFNISH